VDARAQGGEDRRDGRGDRGARCIAVRSRRGRDPRRQHLRLQPDARERPSAAGSAPARGGSSATAESGSRCSHPIWPAGPCSPT
jgi:hypothetical protein